MPLRCSVIHAFDHNTIGERKRGKRHRCAQTPKLVCLSCWGLCLIMTPAYQSPSAITPSTPTHLSLHSLLPRAPITPNDASIRGVTKMPQPQPQPRWRKHNRADERASSTPQTSYSRPFESTEEGRKTRDPPLLLLSVPHSPCDARPEPTRPRARSHVLCPPAQRLPLSTPNLNTRSRLPLQSEHILCLFACAATVW